MSSSEFHTLQRAFAAAGGKWSTFVIWAKHTFTLGRADYQRQYETILYGWKEGTDHFWCGAREQGDVWFFDKPVRNDLHPTMKPVALVERAIRNSSKSRDVVLDPFGGSGSTLIACEKAGRQARLVELDPRYVDTIVLRWQEFSGATVILDGDGRSFEEIAAEREVARSLGVCRAESLCPTTTTLSIGIGLWNGQPALVENLKFSVALSRGSRRACRISGCRDTATRRRQPLRRYQRRTRQGTPLARFL